MNEILAKRLETEINRTSLSETVKTAVLKQVELDLILPTLQLDDNSEVSVLVEDEIFVQIGPRDFQYDLNTGDFLTCGTMMNVSEDAAEEKEVRRIN